MYLQVEYPSLVKKYFKLFEMFDFDIFPNIVPENKYWMDSVKGFNEEEVDALFFRNAS